MGLGQGSGGVGSSQTGSHLVGMGESLRSSAMGSVTVGLLLVLEVASVDFCLSFTPDAPSSVSKRIIGLGDRKYDEVTRWEEAERLSRTLGYGFLLERDTSVADELAEGYGVRVVNKDDWPMLVGIQCIQDGTAYSVPTKLLGIEHKLDLAQDGQ